MTLKRVLIFFVVLTVGLLLFSEAAANPAQLGEKAEKRPHFTFLGLLFGAKYILMIIIGLTALILLVTRRMKDTLKITLLLLSTLLFGLVQNIPGKFFSSFAMHPSPMCTVTKSLLYGFRTPFLVSLLIIFFLTLIGPKLFCGYICPIGAIQELVSRLANKMKVKPYQFNFRIAYGIRLGLFILFIFISATAILTALTPKGKLVPRSIYDYVNAFHGLELELDPSLMNNLIHYLPFILTVLLAFKIYRPFCHFVCPLGMVANFLEQSSLFRISLKKKSCTRCNICIQKSPCTAVEDIIKESNLRPDCYTCNICVEICPENALKIGIKKTLTE
jgi:polyferredoxin